ncbi:MAG: T9SS type A sorting domain-containing protein [Bacteroidales bacterium]|jgi:hypothetical protein|nr:T9SS type A sorting domain-containing protein [Bacteroidales bacterium]
MKKIILLVITTIFSIHVMGQGTPPPNFNIWLLPEALQQNCVTLPVFAGQQYVNPISNYSFGNLSAFAQPYFTDSIIAIKGVAVIGRYFHSSSHPANPDSTYYLQIHSGSLGNVVASGRYDDVVTCVNANSTWAGISSNTGQNWYFEVFFDSTILITASKFYAVATVPTMIPFVGLCCLELNVVSYWDNPNCPVIEPASGLIDSKWDFFSTVTTYPPATLCIFPILDTTPITACLFSSTATNDTIDSTITLATTIDSLGYPLPQKIGFVYDTILTNLTVSNPNAVVYNYNNNNNTYSLTLPYSSLTCNKTYYYRSFVITQIDTTYGGTHDFIIECTNDLQQIDLDNSCKIYPNPAKNELFIQSDFKVMTLEIYNNLGVKVKEMELNRHEAKIDIANLPSGNYTLKLLTTQGEVKKKFVIK